MRVTLCDVFDLQMGKTPSRDNLTYWNGIHKWISIGDLGNADKYICQTKERISDAGVVESGIKLVPAGTVVMSFKLSIGKTAITAENMYTNEAIMAFIDKKAYPVDADYIYHLFSSMDWSEGSNRAVMGVTLNKATLSQKVISIPDINEQRRVAHVLDQLNNLISLHKQQLAKLDELVKARFVEMFGDPFDSTAKWPADTIGNICFVTKLAGFEYTNHIKYQNTGDVIMIRGLNVKNKKLKLDDIYYIDAQTSDLLPRSQLKENDIVMTYVGVNIGDVALVDGQHRYHLAPNVAKISPHSFETIDSLFFVNLLLFNKENFASNATNTAKQALNMNKIRNLQVMLPPITLQRQFASFSTKIDDSKLTIQQSLDKLEVLKKSLMQEYFG